MKPQRFGIRDLLEKYVKKHNIFEIAAPLLEEPESTQQDSAAGRKPLNAKESAERQRLATEITNVQDEDIRAVRGDSPFKYFLDGCRKTYHLCDLSTNGGYIVPLIAGQFSSAIVSRDNETGRISLYKHDRNSIAIILSGGDGLNGEDAKELVRKIEERATSTGQMFYAKDVHLKKTGNNKKPVDNKIEKPQDKAIPDAVKEKAEAQSEKVKSLLVEVKEAEPNIDGALEGTTFSRKDKETVRKVLEAVYELYEKTSDRDELIARVLQKLKRTNKS